MYCANCGANIETGAGFCSGCGAPAGTPGGAAPGAPPQQPRYAAPPQTPGYASAGAYAPARPGVSDKKILVAFLLCWFLGFLGVHRFYVGKVGTGILEVITIGGLGIWVLIDFIMIIVGAFTDKQGNYLKDWT